MIRIDEINGFENVEINPEMKAFLTEKFADIARKYTLSGMSGMFSVVVLEENEGEYFADRMLEFCEKMTFDDTEYIHTVCASESYSEDIYIPYSVENMRIIESRCSDV